ncbi:MAG: ATPase, partial [Clostridium sp.]|nr:ATPase [Clostridium sp.]
YDYTLHPESKKLKECRASDHIPEWRRNPETPEPDFSGLIKPRQKTPKPKAPKKQPVQADAIPENPYPDAPDILPADFPTDKNCGIVVTDKRSIMS